MVSLLDTGSHRARQSRHCRGTAYREAPDQAGRPCWWWTPW